MPTIKQLSQRTWQAVLSTAQGLWLFFLYVWVGYIMIGSLGSLQLRDALEAAPEGGTFDQVISSKSEFERKIEIIQKRNPRNDQSMYEEVDLLEVEIQRLWDDIFDQAIKAKIISDQLIEEEPENYYHSLINKVRESCSRSSSQPTSKQPVNSEICTVIQDYSFYVETADQMYIQINQQLSNFESEQEMKDIEEIKRIREQTPFQDLFTTVEFMDELNALSFLQQPREILVLQLTMVMGTLGSLVTMTWLYIRRDTDLGIRRTLFLPLVGSVSAFIIFVFFKAGQLTISSGGGSSSLSPFFLSFVGIISGLLSERAYARMESVGTKFFTVEGDNLRWGVRLRQAIEETGITVTMIANYLGLEEGKINNIIDEVTPATQEQQTLIAACLRRESRELFTDEPPMGQFNNKQRDPSYQYQGDNELPPTTPGPSL
ncbi:hypothetical protein [Glaciecola sp. KUL10]|uniref:hypothetical protein n=1 Tax=Glaciecola sp. (strain KUL10) TaxID=2161813 RepID=UPI000D78822D|nr:hypothetical protein [Glaciecola sp. KUL10]GBL05002.1 hypothetical protein KUL10_23200 [Glaciecola sp. KUL10]